MTHDKKATKVHYWEGNSLGGRFAITACRPDGHKGVIEVSQDKEKITCSSCLKRINKGATSDFKYSKPLPKKLKTTPINNEVLDEMFKIFLDTLWREREIKT